MSSWKWVAVALAAVVLGSGVRCMPEQRPRPDGGTCDGRELYFDANAIGRDVSGIALTRYRQLSGDTSRPADFSKTPLEAYQLASDTWRPAAVTYGDCGQFTLAVPEGTTYAVHFGSRWFVGNARALDLSSYQTGRPDAEPFPDGGTPAISISVGNLAPWGPFDTLTLASDTAPDTLQITPFGLGGETALTDPSPSLFSLTTPSFQLDAAKHDRAMLMQMHQVTGDNVDPISAACVRALDFSPLSMKAGVTAALEGAMIAPPQKAFTADLKLSQLSAIAAQVHPAAVPESGMVDIVPVPGPLDMGWIGYLGELLFVQAVDPAADLTGTFSYANPREGGWSELAASSAGFYVPMAVGTTTPARIRGYWQHLEPVSTASGKSIGVTMTPPTDFRVEGADGHANATLTSLTPLLSWAPPSIGVANGYWIYVYRLEVSGTRTVRRTVASVLTAQTQLRLPPGFIESGKSYAIVVYAEFMGPPHDFRTSPFYDYSLQDSAPAISGLLTAP